MEPSLTPGDFDLVKERIDIVQLVGERVQLRRAGRTYKGLCPFHSEKTPSFTVDPDRKTFHCFGCSEKGDVFDWLMKTEGIEKSEALRTLAERAGVQLSRQPRAENERTKRLLSAHETALFYFRQALRGTPGGEAVQRYLAKRGISPATVDKFGLGYAPATRNGLLEYLRKKGFSDDEAVGSGLVLDHERGLFDRFRERLMVPVRDAKGRVIAFGGRAMRADQPAKYVNSPQTPLFNKSAVLYALDVARPAIRKANEAVIVEGYFDAIASHQAGFDNVVASQGTALTEEQYRVLDDMKIERAVVAFDADAAGSAAAEKRGRELVRIVRRSRQGAVSTRVGLGVYVAQLPQGDPDELARSDPERYRQVLGEAKPVLEYVIDRIASRFDLSGEDGRRRFLAEAVPLLADEPDQITREDYLKRLNRLTGISHEALRAEATKPPAAAPAPRPAARPAAESATPVRIGNRTGPTERYLMAQLVQFPEEAARIELAPEDLVTSEHREIFELLRAGKRPDADFPAHLAATVAALGAQSPEPASTADVGQAIEIAALRLREQGVLRRLGEAQAALARATDGDVGGLAQQVTVLAEELVRVQQALERATVLRHTEEYEG
ncbi:MAG TPA: DNA primase [Candidatus Limnocylindria bacterium]|nr:DNA primase [Candidatus Limnocylindria bacterium]